MEIKFKEYKKIRVTEQDAVLEELLKLSKEWASEKCCPAYYKKEPIDFLNHDVYFAVDQDCIVGYALGHISVQEEKTSYNKVGEKGFELDEIYVLRTYRNKGVGKELYRFLEKDIWNSVDVIRVNATSYQYKSLLKFYIEELDLQFNYALLVKRTNK